MGVFREGVENPLAYQTRIMFSSRVIVRYWPGNFVSSSGRGREQSRCVAVLCFDGVKWRFRVAALNESGPRRDANRHLRCQEIVVTLYGYRQSMMLKYHSWNQLEGCLMKCRGRER